ncbi:DoxX family protein [Paucibacter sp. B2R-40]|uniref:DoxX family protein n=1 Tax=Paucibacter sp. B2R-40 TaxID=2893554 RepID=UPI0021E42AF5|nr:DoxX family protein [Paucibacter sp. B2R-40]MCV2355559.1 DoxX family protein [Paucibacter sp. B2R-40]
MKAILSLVLRALCNPGQSCGLESSFPEPLRGLLAHAQSLALLMARLFVAKAFFLSGLTKIHDWSTTLALFETEYMTPLLSPELAAWMGTGGELLLPVFLVLGLGGRFAALGLSVVNVMAVLSLSDIAPAALVGHQLWGVLLLAVVLWGAGRWSLDALLQRRLTPKAGS